MSRCPIHGVVHGFDDRGRILDTCESMGEGVGKSNTAKGLGPNFARRVRIHARFRRSICPLPGTNVEGERRDRTPRLTTTGAGPTFVKDTVAAVQSFLVFAWSGRAVSRGTSGALGLESEEDRLVVGGGLG